MADNWTLQHATPSETLASTALEIIWSRVNPDRACMAEHACDLLIRKQEVTDNKKQFNYGCGGDSHHCPKVEEVVARLFARFD
uniref:Uncharacterized protein n=1 Tax=Magnetococcus massalia (strain MO-1) TaxID=451514 RepID=A0A1S7LF71_MAGMO|nr:protein of unknown function [Candidatus Magnetococcus massalia]